MPAKTPVSKIATKEKPISFEEALAELEDITRKLESGQETLENSMTLYQRGIELKKVCEEKISSAEEKWKILRQKGKEKTTEDFT